MSRLNGFLSNLGQGLTQGKGNLGDFQHAARLYNSQAHRLAPKQKFLYHVVFNINPAAIKSTSFDVQKSGTAINMLVKSVDMPKFKVSVETVQQYNKKRQIQTRLDYDPINVSFHDDNQGLTTALWSLYYGYYFADSAHGGSAGAAPGPGTSGAGSFLGSVINAVAPGIGQAINTISSLAGGTLGRQPSVNGSSSSTTPAAYYKNAYFKPELVKFRYGLDNFSSFPFFTSIQIFQMSRKQYQCYTLINPIITSWQHDNLDNSDGAGTTENKMTIAYEAVFYGTGAVKEGNPAGFGTEYYDKGPSPLTLLGGGSKSLFGQGGVLGGISSVFGDIASGRAFSDPRAFLGTLIKGANVVNNAKQLTKEGIRQEGFGIIKGAIGAATGIDVSGVQNIVFPKSSGSGQNQKTQATSPIQIASTNPLTAQQLTKITNTPGAIESIAQSFSGSNYNSLSDAQKSSLTQTVKNTLEQGTNPKLNSIAAKALQQV